MCPLRRVSSDGFTFNVAGATCCRMMAHTERMDTKSRRYMQLTMSNKLAAATAYCTRPQDLYTTQSDTDTHTYTPTERDTYTCRQTGRQFVYSANFWFYILCSVWVRPLGTFFAARSVFNVSFQGQTRRQVTQVNTGGLLSTQYLWWVGVATNYHVN